MGDCSHQDVRATKQRLANVLNEEERRSLMLAMARDMLTCLSKAKNLDGILIVSQAPGLMPRFRLLHRTRCRESAYQRQVP